MAAFCGLNYENVKSKVVMTCVWVDGGGTNIRAGIELSNNLIRKMDTGESAVFCGETFRSSDGSVRCQLADGSGWASILSAEGNAFFSPPAQPAVQSSTDSPKVHFVTLNARTYRYISSYRVVLKKLGFVSTNEAVSLPATITFEHPSGVDRAVLNSAFETLQTCHLARDYDFPKPAVLKAGPLWWKYEQWMQYKKEISIWAD